MQRLRGTRCLVSTRAGGALILSGKRQGCNIHTKITFGYFFILLIRFYDAGQKETKLNEEDKNRYVLLILLENWILLNVKLLTVIIFGEKVNINYIS